MLPMTTYVALLRGINVGGHNKVAMAALRSTCESVGCTDVATYIQSGNVVLISELSENSLRAALERAIVEQLAVSPTVMIRSATEMAAVVDETPYPEAADNTVHVGFLHEPLDATPLHDLEASPEEFTVSGRHLYLYLPDGMGRAQLPVELGRRVKAPMTLRNWRTVSKLLQMATA